MRYFVAGVGFVLMWILVSALVGVVVLMIFPPPDNTSPADIAVNWRNLPGTVLGLLAGWRSAQASLKVGE